MEEDLASFIAQNQLFRRGEKGIIALSGGIDSVVMLHLLAKLNHYRLTIVHCNFKLRGEASDEDARFCATLAKKYALPYYEATFETQHIAKAKGVSIQMAARALRYEFFEQVRQQTQAHWIATAHHASDNAETVLINLIRGTGVNGFQGIPLSVGYLRRPLLFATREMVTEYAARHELDWREDISNASDKYQRNFIRHHIMPLIKVQNPAFEAGIMATTEKVQSAVLLANLGRQEWWRKLATEKSTGIAIDIEAVKKFSSPQQLLFGLLEGYGFTLGQCKSMAQLPAGQSGKEFKTDKFRVITDREIWWLVEKAEFTQPDEKVWQAEESLIQWEKEQISWHKLQRIPDKMPKTTKIALLDAEKIAFPLKIRRWRKGDKFQPLGMKGQKKISDFLTDLKLPLHLKEQVAVITSGDQIVWVVGYRISDKFKIDEITQKAIQLSLVQGA